MRFRIGVLPQLFLFVVFFSIASVESSGEKNLPIAKEGHRGVSCPTQWRDYIVVERIVFRLDNGERDLAYVPMAFIPRQEVNSWPALIEILPSYSITNHISVHFLSVVVYRFGWDWDDGPTEYTPEGRPIGTSGTLALRVNFDDYMDVLERVRVIVFPYTRMLTDSGGDMAYAVGGVTPPPPSPPFGFLLRIGLNEYMARECVTGDYIFWCQDCNNYCPAVVDPRPSRRSKKITCVSSHDNKYYDLGVCPVKWIPHFEVKSIEFVSKAGRITTFTTAHLALSQRANNLPTHLRLSVASYWGIQSVHLLVKAGTRFCSIITTSPYLGFISNSTLTTFTGKIAWNRKPNPNLNPTVNHPRWISDNLTCGWTLGESEGGQLTVAPRYKTSFLVEIFGGSKSNSLFSGF